MKNLFYRISILFLFLSYFFPISGICQEAKKFSSIHFLQWGEEPCVSIVSVAGENIMISRRKHVEFIAHSMGQVTIEVKYSCGNQGTPEKKINLSIVEGRNYYILLDGNDIARVVDPQDISTELSKVKGNTIYVEEGKGELKAGNAPKQKDGPSTIHFIRSSKVMASACNYFVFMPGQEDFEIQPASQFHFYWESEGQIQIKVKVSCPGSFVPRYEDLYLDVENGRHYYVYLRGTTVIESVDSFQIWKEIEKSRHMISTRREGEMVDRDTQKSKFSAKQGSAFLINNQGYLFTNYHVVEGGGSFKVRSGNGPFGEEYEGKLIAVDPPNDIALLKIDISGSGLDTLPYGLEPFSEVLSGENVFTLGYPVEAVMGNEIKITKGIINSKSGFLGSLSSCQISTVVQPGNSGSPLFNENGQIIGMVNSKLYSEGIENVSYAIKSDYLITFLNQIPQIKTPEMKYGLEEMSLPEQVQILSKFIFIVEVEE